MIQQIYYRFIFYKPGHGMCRLHDLSSIAKPRHPFLVFMEFCSWYLVHVLVRLWYPNKPHEWVQIVHSVKSDHFEPKAIM